MSLRKPFPEERWGRIENLFSRALDLPARRWQPFLENECGSDTELRDEVLSLLTWSGEEDLRLVGALEASAASLIEDNPSGRMLGPYRVERELGRGGMAVVYLSSRADGQFQKRVAIKLIKRGMDTAAVIERLRRERRILAALDHPFIAHLLDGGSTAEGSPYLVMEFVEGVPIDRFCDQRSLGIEERCELVAKVCQAVSYAHRKLVVHRDLKPGNILITAEGSPKLLDFGLAKILDPDSEGSVTVNATQPRPLTPDYASPEQMRGLELTTATDIYSLGVILYELLSGQRPYRLPGSPCEQWKRVCDTDPPRPSEVAGAARRRLAGDLDNIVMKAMHKDAERRYPSADELAADLRRHLEMRPVLARKDSLWYRGAKFARRRKYPLLAAGVALAGLLAGFTVAISEARRAEAARQVAEAREKEAERARQVAETEHVRAERQRDMAVAEQKHSEERLSQIVSLSDRSLSSVYALMERLPGAVPARKELIETTFDALNRLSKEAETDERLRLSLGKAYLRLGDLQGGEGISMNDAPAAIRSYRAGAALLENTPLEKMPREQMMAWLELKRKMVRLMGNHDAKSATPILLQMIDQTAKLPGYGSDLEFARARAALLLSVSRISHVNLALSRDYSAKYLKACEDIQKRMPDRLDLQYDVSVAQVESGYLDLVSGDPEKAAEFYAKAMHVREQLVKRAPNDGEYRHVLMLIYRHYARVLGGPAEPNLGNRAEARIYLEKARPLAEEAVGDPNNVSALASYGAFLMEIAAMEERPEHREESLAKLRRAAAIYASMPGNLVTNSYGIPTAGIYYLIGLRLADAGDTAGAMHAQRHAVELADSVLADRPDREALRLAMESEEAMSRTLAKTGDRAGAMEHALRLLERIAEGARHGGDPAFLNSWRARGYLTLALAHRDFGEREPAKENAERALTEAMPLALNRPWDRNTRIMREAQAVIAGARGTE